MWKNKFGEIHSLHSYLGKMLVQVFCTAEINYPEREKFALFFSFTSLFNHLTKLFLLALKI